MPGNLLNTLYPPQIDTFLPAFINTEDAVIYFSLSPFNTENEIARVHISLQNQLNNENALVDSSGILFSNLRYDSVSGLYYAVIPTLAVENNQFNINQFYKVQIRFDKYGINSEEQSFDSLTSTPGAKTAYLINYQQYFSEWSSVCLIRPISKPEIAILPFDNDDGSDINSTNVIAFNKGIIPISGKVVFGDGVNDSETLQSFNIQILNKEKEIVFNTKEIYTGSNLNPNAIDYKLDLQTLNTNASTDFYLKLNITSKNQYQTSKTYPFTIADFLEDDSFHPNISVTVDNEDGIATLKIKNEESIFGTLYIKRASSFSNFQDYEDIWTDKIAGPVDLTITDNTIGSLAWYRYSVQLENSKGGLTQVFRSDKFLPEFYDVILSRKNQQFRIQYNYKISGYKPVVNRSKIDTLGGRYPKFVENAILNYKQFSISGSISATNDMNEKFLKQSEYFDNDYHNFLIYNQEDESHIGYLNKDSSIYLNREAYEHNDFFWEREFREAALAWLNDGEPKLYRSMAEGSMVVMLTDITLTPNTVTGRRIWDFSATAYEIAKADSLTDLDTLGIYDIHKLPENKRGGGGDVDPTPEYVEVIKVGQIYQHIVTDRNNIISSIIEPAIQSKYGGVLSDKDPTNFYLKNVKIFFHNKPNQYRFSAGNAAPALVTSITSEEDKNKIQLGYSFGLQTQGSEGISYIFVNDKGYYQIPNELDVTGLTFLNMGETYPYNGQDYTIPPDIVTIEYVLVYQEKNNQRTIVSGTSVNRSLLGQEQGTFKANEYLGEKIRNKYNFIQPDIITETTTKPGYVQKMQFWKGISIEAMPYSVVHLLYKGETAYNDYIIGHTGVLNMIKNAQIQDLCFLGRRMTKVDKNRQCFLQEWEYIKDDSDTIYASTKEIINPKFNNVYHVQDELKIYHQFQWFTFKEDTTNNTIGIAEVPINATINYVGDILQSSY